VTISEFQEKIERAYLARDRDRGTAGTFVWFVEEVGELARAIQRGTDRANLEEEFADCLAWLSTLASLHGVRLEEAARKYDGGCPCCRAAPCACPAKR
jgi:NTP pyrophosphatase (non-canonical NTP hydrolase)